MNNLIQQLQHLFFTKDPFNQLHLEVALNGRHLRFNCFSHEEYILLKEQQLKELFLNVDPDSFIKTALKQASNCNFIVFECDDYGRFVQFWLGDGALTVSWPIVKVQNKMDQHLPAMLLLLRELGVEEITTKSGIKINNETVFYEIDLVNGFRDYQIHFAHNYDVASEFTTRVFRDVFDQDLQNIQFRIG